MDWMVQEQERGITITSAATTCEWEKYEINIIDTPGHVDFTIEVERSLRVLDGAVGVFCAVGGVEPQSETVWAVKQINIKFQELLLLIKWIELAQIFIMSLRKLKKNLGKNAAPAQIPIGAEDEFQGVIDLVEMKKIIWNGEDLGAKFEVMDLDDDQKEEAEMYREELIGSIADFDEELQIYLGGEEITVATA
jgi:elongation factor G